MNLRGPERSGRQAIQELVLRWYREVWNEKRESSLFELLHPKAWIHGIDTEPVQGPEGFLPFWRMVHLNYNQVRIRVDQLLIESDQALVRLSHYAIRADTQQESWTRGAACFQVRGARFVKTRHVMDNLALLAQSQELDLDFHEALFPIQALPGRE